jgi:hypothetical protein
LFLSFFLKKQKQNKMGTHGPADYKEITTQSEVTVNADVNHSLMSIRQGNVTAKLPTITGIVNEKHLFLSPMEMFFIKKDDQKPYRSRTHYMIEGFTALNGEVIEAESQEDFEEQYRFVGFVTGSKYFEDDMPAQESGIAVRMKGSGSTINNGRDTLCNGDTFGWCFPPIDPSADLEAFYSVADAVPSGTWARSSKRLGVVKKISWEDSITAFQDIALYLTRKMHKVNIPMWRANAMTGTFKKKPLFNQALAMKEMGMLYAFNAIMAMTKRGYIVPTCGETTDVARDPGAFRVWIEKISGMQDEANAYGNFREKKIVTDNIDSYLTSGLELVQELNETERIDRERAFESWAKIVACLLGLASHKSLAFVTPDNILGHMILTRSHFSVLPGLTNSTSNTSIANLITSEFINKDEFTKNAHGQIRSHELTICGQILACHQEAAMNFQQLVAHSLNSLNEHAIGVASNYCPPGRMLHYIM